MDAHTHRITVTHTHTHTHTDIYIYIFKRDSKNDGMRNCDRVHANTALVIQPRILVVAEGTLPNVVH